MKRARNRRSKNEATEAELRTERLLKQHKKRQERLEKQERKNKKKRKQSKHQGPNQNRSQLKRKRKQRKYIVRGIVVAIILAAMSFLLYMCLKPGKLIAPIDRETGRINTLILGVDDDGLRTDTIMIASYDLETCELDLVSIPRDTKVYVENRQQTRKINEVHSLSMQRSDGTIVGPEGTAKAVMQMTGIPINYYIEFSFDTVEELFNIFGPITYDVPDVEGGGKGMNYDDPEQDLYIHLKPGKQELNGEQVLQLMRYRKSNDGTNDSDTNRRERQQGIIKALIEQKLNAELILKIPDIFTTIQSKVKTNWTIGDVTRYYKYLEGLTSDKVQSYQLPGEDKYQNGKWYFIQNIEQTKEVLKEVEAKTDNITTTVTVEVENGIKPLVTKREPKPTSTPTPTPTPTPKPTQSPSVSSAPDDSNEGAVIYID